jgi:ubiquinone/menaquinone biosynthesis C-methylase UbiE
MFARTHQLFGCALLNARVVGQALSGRWLTKGHFATGYDRVAATYDDQWLTHIRRVTGEVVDRALDQCTSLPDHGSVIDLGCGTGIATYRLADAFPEHPVFGVDVSRGMLARARADGSRDNITYLRADMLGFMRTLPDSSAALIAAAWSIGYSDPPKLIREIGRVLLPGGTFVFVVNTVDTLSPVFLAFRRAMIRYPAQVRLAYWPHFPRSLSAMEPILRRAGLVPVWSAQDCIVLPWPSARPRLPWLLQTGVLAGFDSVLPLREPGPVARFVEEQLQTCMRPLEHHYIAAVTRKEAS